MTFKLFHADCRHIMMVMPEASVDSIVTDPPYELGFMGKLWDASGIAYDVEMWRQALRILKPGGHLLAFGGSRTYHRMAVAIEDAGFEIRDQIMWVYGSGFPKSYDIAQSIEKKNTIGKARRPDRDLGLDRNRFSGSVDGSLIADTGGKVPLTTAEAQQWEGWGTALKPAHEPIVVARKPLIGTVAANVLAHGTGGLNIDGCRVPTADNRDRIGGGSKGGSGVYGASTTYDSLSDPGGRFPANLIHDGSDEVLAEFPSTAPSKSANRGLQGRHDPSSPDTKNIKENSNGVRGVNDAGGSAARFFYCAKTSKADRDEGVATALQAHVAFQTANGTSGKASSLSDGRDTQYRNIHPTVKPEDLMRYLCRMVTPPSGTVFDPFTGSGSTGKAAMLEGFKFIGCELTAEYIPIANARIGHAMAKALGLVR